MSENAAFSGLDLQAPYYVLWEITHRCDARCGCCYASAGPDVETAGELSTAEALGVIDQMVEAGRPMLAFSGGEPLLRPDWRQLIRYAVARELVVTVVTNGSTIGEPEAAELHELGVESVTVSLDSHQGGLHDELRRKPGLHRQAVEAIRWLARSGVRVVVNFTPTRLNWRDLRGTVELAQQLGAQAFSLSEYVPTGRGTAELALAADQMQELCDDWQGVRESFSGRIGLVADDRTVAMLSTGAGSPDCPDCGAGRTATRILPDGTVTPCAFLPVPLGSFRRETFEKIWQCASLMQDVRARAGEIGSNCSTCGMLARSRETAR